MDKTYLLDQYRLAVLDFQTAHTEEDQWNARKQMANIERTALELFGTELEKDFEQMKATIR